MKTASLAPAFVFVLAGSTVWAQEPDAANPPPPPDSPPPVVAEPSGKDPLVGEIPLENEAMNRAFVGEDEPKPLLLTPRPHRFGVYLGVRAMNIKDAGYDPYSESDALAQNAFGLSFTPWRSRPWSVHLLAEYNYGGSSAYARNVPTQLDVHRFALGVEGRWMPRSRFYLYAKVVPALARIYGEIDDSDLGVSLESASTAFLCDTSAGAALRLGTAGKEPKRTVSFWLMMDWGYTFATQTAMSFSPANIDDETRKFGAINLPGLRLGGFVTRGAFAITF
jgi:hypothetical protein